jgi:hypothetical protein
VPPPLHLLSKVTRYLHSNNILLAFIPYCVNKMKAYGIRVRVSICLSLSFESFRDVQSIYTVFCM